MDHTGPATAVIWGFGKPTRLRAELSVSYLLLNGALNNVICSYSYAEGPDIRRPEERGMLHVRTCECSALSFQVDLSRCSSSAWCGWKSCDVTQNLCWEELNPKRKSSLLTDVVSKAQGMPSNSVGGASCPTTFRGLS